MRVMFPLMNLIITKWLLIYVLENKHNFYVIHFLSLTVHLTSLDQTLLILRGTLGMGLYQIKRHLRLKWSYFYDLYPKNQNLKTLCALRLKPKYMKPVRKFFFGNNQPSKPSWNRFYFMCPNNLDFVVCKFHARWHLTFSQSR